MGDIHRASLIVHDQPVNPAGTGALAYYQPEGLMDWAIASDNGLTWQLDVHSIVGSADSWYLTCKFQIAIGDIAGSGWSQQRWRDLQADQVAKLIVEGVDWYGGSPAPFNLTNLCTNPSLEAVSTGWSALSGTGGTAANARQTTFGWSGTSCMRTTWSVGTSVPNTGGVSTQKGAAAVGNNYSGSIRLKPSKDQWMRANLEFRDAGNLVITTRQGLTTFCPANVWTKVLVENKPAPTNTTQVDIAAVAANGSTAWLAGDMLDSDACMLNVGETVQSYFDGDSDGGAWTGTANQSTSTLLVTPTAPDANVVARSTDTLPITVSRTIKNFGRLVRVWIVPVAVNPSSDFAVKYTLTAGY